MNLFANWVDIFTCTSKNSSKIIKSQHKHNENQQTNSELILILSVEKKILILKVILFTKTLDNVFFIIISVRW